jgi:hypothetical protein
MTALRSAQAPSGKHSRLRAVLPPHVDMILCHATGLIHQLSFLDQYKSRLHTAGAAPLLLSAMSTRNPQTYENATGVWLPPKSQTQGAGPHTYVERLAQNLCASLLRAVI